MSGPWGWASGMGGEPDQAAFDKGVSECAVYYQKELRAGAYTRPLFGST